MSAHPMCLNLCLHRQADILHEAVKRLGYFASLRAYATVLALHFHHYVTSGWEREVQGQAPGTGVSSGRCGAAPCAWWRPRCDGIVVPPGTP